MNNRNFQESLTRKLLRSPKLFQIKDDEESLIPESGIRFDSPDGTKQVTVKFINIPYRTEFTISLKDTHKGGESKKKNSVTMNVCTLYRLYDTDPDEINRGAKSKFDMRGEFSGAYLNFPSDKIRYKKVYQNKERVTPVPSFNEKLEKAYKFLEVAGIREPGKKPNFQKL